MAKGMYVGIDSISRKIKKAYVGVDGVARKIKKSYIGINGVAQLCYMRSVVHLGHVQSVLKSGNEEAAMSSLPKYAVIGGGWWADGPSCISSVQFIDASFTITGTSYLSEWRRLLSATHSDNCVVFAGGVNDDSDFSSAVDGFTGPSGSAAVLNKLSYPKRHIGATHVGNYMFFAGGYGDGTYYSSVDIYRGDFTKMSTLSLSAGRGRMGATHVGDYAIFAGGATNSSNYNSKVEAFSSSLTKNTAISSLDTAVAYPIATHIGNYAIFAGGRYSAYVSSASESVTIYDSSLTKHASDPFEYYAIANGDYPTGVAGHINNDYALLSLGLGSDGVHFVSFDTSLTRSALATSSQVPCRNTGFAHLEDIAMFSSGRSVHAFTLE